MTGYYNINIDDEIVAFIEKENRELDTADVVSHIRGKYPDYKLSTLRPLITRHLKSLHKYGIINRTSTVAKHGGVVQYVWSARI